MLSFSAPAGFVVIMLLNSVLRGWLQRKARESPARLRGNRHVILYSRALCSCVVGYAIVLAAISIYFFLLVSRMGPYATGLEELFIFVAIMTFLIMAPLLLHIFLARIEYDSTHVYTFSPWREDRTVSWSDIVGHSFSRVLKQHIFSTKEGEEIRFGVLLSGYEDFLDEARRRGIAGLSKSR